jgi:hypothetical protein
MDHPAAYGELLARAERQVAEITRLLVENERLYGRIDELEAEPARRDPDGAARTRPPAWVKANKPPRSTEKGARKKRPHGYARKRSVPSVTAPHAVDACPDCGCSLQGGTAKHQREIIEITLPPAVVTDHVLLERVCPLCGTTCVLTWTRVTAWSASIALARGCWP